MGWEKRGKTLCYYRKRRVGDKVVSEYMGSGRLAILAARLDEHERDLRDRELAVVQGERERMQAIDTELDLIWERTVQLVRATLVSEGFHTHKGEWRRTRG